MIESEFAVLYGSDQFDVEFNLDIELRYKSMQKLIDDIG